MISGNKLPPHDMLISEYIKDRRDYVMPVTITNGEEDPPRFKPGASQKFIDTYNYMNRPGIYL
jgi:hypothetical protein